MLRSALRLTAGLAAAALLSACSALSALEGAATPLDVYELRAPAELPTAPRRNLQVTVELPTTTGALETDRVMVRPGPLAAQYLDDARWSEDVPIMVQSLMLRSLQRTGAFAYVGRTPLGVAGDVALVTDVLDFQAESRGEAAEVRLALRVEAVREADVAILGSRLFQATAPARGTSTPELMAAFDAAAQRLLGEIAGWAVTVLR
ncbi:ABC-type transport auxiliary lipoprotein family protein [Roseivivax sp. CAU 1761]